jgi:hypothetical protein
MADVDVAGAVSSVTARPFMPALPLQGLAFLVAGAAPGTDAQSPSTGIWSGAVPSTLSAAATAIWAGAPFAPLVQTPSFTRSIGGAAGQYDVLSFYLPASTLGAATVLDARVYRLVAGSFVQEAAQWSDGAPTADAAGVAANADWSGVPLAPPPALSSGYGVAQLSLVLADDAGVPLTVASRSSVQLAVLARLGMTLGLGA